MVRILLHKTHRRPVPLAMHWQKEEEGPVQETRLQTAGEGWLMGMQGSLPLPAARSIGYRAAAWK